MEDLNDIDYELKHIYTKRSLNSNNNIPLGVIYLSNPDTSGVSSFNFNAYFPKVVDIALDQLSIDQFYIVKIPININISLSLINPIQLKYIADTLKKYPYITYFVCSAPTTYIDYLFEAFFRYNHDKILLTTGSSQVGANYSDNVIRYLPNDNTLGSFLSTLYLNEYPFDLIYIPGTFITYDDTTNKTIYTNLGFDAVKSSIEIINNFLQSVGKSMEPSPYNPNNQPTGLPSVPSKDPLDPSSIDIGPLLTSIANQSADTMIRQIALTLRSNADYYTKNYYFSTNLQYVLNGNAINNKEWQAKYGTKSRICDWLVESNYLIEFKKVNGNVVPVYDNSRWSYLDMLCIYLAFFDYRKEKKIVIVMAQYQFPVFIAALNDRLPFILQKLGSPPENTKTIIEDFIANSSIILSNVNNSDEFTFTLFNDPQTYQLWYPNNPITWYELTNKYPLKMVIPRTDQSIFMLLDKMSRILNLRQNGKYYDISNSPQPLINALYNLLSMLLHFTENNIDLGQFILSYFLNTNLLQYGNNLLFDNNMDNQFNVTVSTSYFYSGTSVISRKLRATTDCQDTTIQCSGFLPIISSRAIYDALSVERKTAVKNNSCGCPGYIKGTFISGVPFCWKIDPTYYYKCLNGFNTINGVCNDFGCPSR